MSGFANIVDYGADPTGQTSCYHAVMAAQDTGKTILIPPGTFNLSGETVRMVSGRTWLGHGGEFIHQDDTVPMFLADGIEDLNVFGSLKCSGLLTTEADTGESAIQFINPRNVYVQRIEAKLFKGDAVRISGSDTGERRGDGLTIGSLSTHKNKTGLRVSAGSGAEYCLINNVQATGNATGAVVGAGNVSLLGGTIEGNVDGVVLVDGPNHGHGVLSSLHINHNSGLNLRGYIVTNGYTIQGCHFYGDSPTAGKILLEDCAGVSISGGIISVAIEIVGTSYVNAIRNNFITGSASVSGTGVSSTRIEGNLTDSGYWAGNNY